MPAVSCVFENLEHLSEVWSLVNSENNKYHYLLQSRYYLESHKMIQNDRCDGVVITDFSLNVHHFIYSQWARKSGLINYVEWTTLCQLLDICISSLPNLSGLIIIKADTTELLENIQERDRALDRRTTLDYLTDLQALYSENIQVMTRDVPCITLHQAELKSMSMAVEDKLRAFVNEILLER